MHISLSPPSTPPEARARRALLEADLVWLREELSGVKSAEQKASLSYQLGVLEQLAGRDSLAVRQLLAAVNTLSHFKEPLERLIVVIERHRSFKNLPTLLEHLCRTAEGSEELSRAKLAQAWCAMLHGHDDATALPLAEAALTAAPSDPAAMLTLELLARRGDDAAVLRRALEARLAAARDPAWAALLALEVAQLEAAAGEHDSAHARLCAAAQADPFGSAFDEIVALSHRAGRSDWALAALDARATRILGALDETDLELGASLPRLSRGRTGALDALLSKARLEQGAGLGAEALRTLERAAVIEPDHPIVARLMLEHARAIGRDDLFEAATERELAAAPVATEAAALWLGLAESRARERRPTAALAALRQVLQLDPQCWLARARELDLLRELRDGHGEARALEQAARDLTDASARSRYWLLAAHAWARGAQLAAPARDALEQAHESGAPQTLIRRLERALAHLIGDREWYGAATRRLLATDLDDAERVGLELESWRHALLAGDAQAASERLSRLEALGGGRRAARLARAFDPDPQAADRARSALAELAELETDAQRSAALGWALALRTSRAAGHAAAIEELQRIHVRYPAAVAVAGTLSSWLRDASEPLRAAAVLRATAATLDDPAFASSLYVEAGLSCWWAGDREAARRDFDAAERSFRGQRAGVLSLWARRATSGFRAESDAVVTDPAERLLGALERATATATPSSSELADLNAALRPTTDEDASGLVMAAHLARLVLGPGLGLRLDPAELERTSKLNPDFARLLESFRYLECMAQAEPSPRALEESTRRWSAGTGGLVATLEWVAACARLGHRGLEGDARERLAELLTGTAAEHARAGSALIAHLTQADTTPLLDGRTPQTALTNLETSPPGCDPRRRARALEGVTDLLGVEAEPMLCLLRGYNQLAAADVEAAISSFRRYTDTYPDDPSGWEGLLSAARRGDDPALLAEAASALGSTCRDPAHAARLFEEAAEIFFDRLGDEVAGQAALTRAVQLDISRSSSFERLLRSMRDSASPGDLVALIERRLPLAASAGEIVNLNWELARLRREAGDLAGASAALDLVAEHEPDHLGALMLSAEIFITTRRYTEAVDRLARVATRPRATAEQRLTSGLAAVDLCENQLGETERALALLSSLEAAGLGNVAVRERLARSAAKAGAWAQAVSIFERLMLERETAPERGEAARLALAIYRDRLNDPGRAGPAAKALLELWPEDPEALDLVLSGALEPALTKSLLELARSALIRSTALAPTDADAMRRLARVAGHLGDIQLRQSALGALVALGYGEDDSRAELVTLERRISTMPPTPVSNDVLAELADPEDTGPMAELLSLVAPYLGEVFGPPRQAFQVSRRERVSARDGAPLLDEIAAWVGAFGLSEFELYVSPVPSERLVVLGTEPIMIIAGASVSAPLGPFQRQALARALYASRRGLSPLLQLDPSDVPAVIAALCSIAKVDLSGPQHPRQRDFERQIARVLPRNTRKLLPERARRVRDAESSLGAWIRAASASLDRVAAVAVGDASVILADAPADALASGPGEERARRLLGFMLSPRFESLRQRFGVSVR
jgi:hypothetical protein